MRENVCSLLLSKCFESVSFHYRRHAFAILTVFFLAFNVASASPSSFSSVVEKTLPAVVSIQATLKSRELTNTFGNFNFPKEFAPFFDDFFRRDRQVPRSNRQAQGSGFIFDAKGLVVTNNHVIKEAEEVKVTLENGDMYMADIVGTDVLTDIAVLKLRNVKKRLPALSFGDSDKSKIGDWVLAIGNPLGLGGSVTKGIISARGRNIKMGVYDDFLQTDAPINRGNSGGPLLNMSGQVIGINSAIITPTGGSVGLGFSIPSNMAKDVAKQLIKNGFVQRAWLGVSFRSVNNQIADSLGLKNSDGVILLQVQPDSPAQKAGLKLGDVILSFDGKKITQHKRLPIIVARTPIGKKVDVVVFRKGKKITLAVQLAKRSNKVANVQSPFSAQEMELAETGLRVANLTKDLRQQYGIDKSVRGIVVVGVSNKSSAYGTIRRGAVISRINNFDVHNVKDAEVLVDKAKNNKKKNLLLLLENGKNKLLITVKIQQ